MGLISDFEEHLGGAIEGAFNGMFKSPVQPAELARACSKEMSRSKKLGVSKVYVSNVYSILLSSRDHSALAGLIPTLQGELETYLLAYSREHDYQMATRPIVRFYSAPDLKLGRFEAIGDMLSVDEIQAELGSVAGVTSEQAPGSRDGVAPAIVAAGESAFASPDFNADAVASIPAAIAAPGFSDLDIDPALAAPGPEDLSLEHGPQVRPVPRLRHDLDVPSVTDDDHRATRALTPNAVPTPPPAPPRAAKTTAYLTMENFGPLTLPEKRTVSIGRQDDNDLVIADANASRHHARLEREGDNWIVVDLGATNTTQVNGARIERARLHDGDVIMIGVTKINYHEKATRR